MRDGLTKVKKTNRSVVLTVAALWWRNKFKVKCRKRCISLLKDAIIGIFDKHLWPCALEGLHHKTKKVTEQILCNHILIIKHSIYNKKMGAPGNAISW